MADDAAFETLAGAELQSLADRLEDALGDVADVDFDAGILTIALDRGGQFVVNKHAPRRQIWLSSPVSGATHYDHRSGDWVGTRDGVALSARLAEELGGLTGRTLRLAD